MGESCALMMKGHGANVTGKTIQEACLNTVHLERTAKMMLRAGSVGRFSPAHSDSSEKIPRRGSWQVE